MVWFCLLLAVDFVGILVLFAFVSGWGVSISVYEWSVVSLAFLGSATLVFHLVRFAVPRMVGLKVSLRLGTRLERSLVRAAALLALSTFLFMLGPEVGPAIVIPSAVGVVSTSLLVITRFRRYTRWRSIRFRRESRTRL